MSKETPDTEYNHTLGALVVRLSWMAVGPLVALFAVLSIVEASSLSKFDLLLWGALFSMVGARYLDVARFNGMTANSEPATMRHVARYASALLAIGLAVWGAAHAVEIE